MSDKTIKLRQLDAAARLRALQREKSELKHARAARALQDAAQRLAQEQDRYTGLLNLYREQKLVGVSLDPFLHEQRLLMQLNAQAELETQLTRKSAALADYQSTAQALQASKVKEDLMRKAHGQAREALQAHARTQEVIDIFDAQQAREASYGL